MTPELPVGAIVASALMAANISCDSGEDVDRFLTELRKRGYSVERPSLVIAASAWLTYVEVQSANTSALDATERELMKAVRDALAGEPDWCGNRAPHAAHQVSDWTCPGTCVNCGAGAHPETPHYFDRPAILPG